MSVNEQNKRQSIVLGLLTLVIVVAVIVVSDMSVQRQAESETQNIAELSATASDTATATFTFTPSLTPTITPTLFPTPWPTPELPPEISGTTLQSIELKYQFGLGLIADIAWSPKENQIALATPLGIRFHDSATLKELDFWPTESDVTALIYTIDGTLISGAASGAINVWNPNGKIGHVLRGTDGPIRFLVLSPDERWLATSSGEEQVALWELTTAKLKYEFYTRQYFNNIQPTRGLVFSPDSTILTAFEFGYGEYNWNVVTGEIVKKLSLFGCDGLPCGPNYRTSTRDGLVIGYLDLYGFVGIRSWDTPSDSISSESIKRLRVGSCDNCGGYNIEFSQDGKLLAAGLDEGLFIFDVVSGQRLLTNSEILAQQFSFSPDGRQLAMTVDFGRLALYEIGTGQQLAVADQYWGKTQAVTFSPEANQLSAGYYSGVINLWQLDKGQFRASISAKLAIDSLLYTPDGQYISFSGRPRRWREYGYRGVEDGFFESQTGQPARPFPSDCIWCDKWLITNPVTPQYFLAISWPETAYFRLGSNKPLWRIESTSRGSVFLPSGDRFIAGDENDSLVIRDVLSGKVQDVIHVPDTWQQFVLNSTGTAIFLSSAYGLYQIDLESHQVVQSVRLENIQTIAISPDDKLLAINQSEGSVTILSTRNFSEIAFTEQHSNAIALSQVADQYWLAIAGDDGIVRVWTFKVTE